MTDITNELREEIKRVIDIRGGYLLSAHTLQNNKEWLGAHELIVCSMVLREPLEKAIAAYRDNDNESMAAALETLRGIEG